MRLDFFTLFPEWFDWFSGQRHVRNARRARLRAALLQLPRLDAAERRPGRRLALRRRRRDGDAGRRRRRRPAGRLRRRAAPARDRPAGARGRPLDDALAAELAAEPHLALLCGRYEGVDERVREHLADDAVSIGPYVLSGGELAAMVVADAVLRKLPGALGDAESALEESFSEALEGAPEYPHYTRPPSYRGWDVPEILLSGDHARGPRVAAGRAAAASEGADRWPLRRLERSSSTIGARAGPRSRRSRATGAASTSRPEPIP